MKEYTISIRNYILRFLYKTSLQKIFFLIDPEVIHDRMLKVGEFLGSNVVGRNITSVFFSYSNKSLEQKILGIKFANPVGLAAGFDKDARLTDILPSVGFGFAEVGSITGEVCSGNPKPRLWRLKKSQSLVVNYGLKNEGCETIAKRLKRKTFAISIGTNIAKTNSPKTVNVESGIADYVKAYKSFTDIGSFFTINISCPNAYGGKPFEEASRLEELLLQIDNIPTKKPVFLKISPDLTRHQVDRITQVASRHQVSGFVCSNLTKNRKSKKILDKKIPSEGGMSGKVVEDLTNELIAYVYKKTKGKLVIIGCGGVFNAADAYKKIKLGASLVEMITGMIFEGPQVVSEINQGLVRLLKKDGFNRLSQAVSVGIKD